MVTELDTTTLLALLGAVDGVQLLDVGTAASFEEEHLPDALSVPLESVTVDGTRGLDSARPTVVHGFDHECDRSPRAAARLEALGFRDVYDYRPGKAAWLADGLPAEGRRRAEQRVGSIADATFPTVPGDGTVGDAVGVFASSVGLEAAVALDGDGVVLGLVRHEVTGLSPSTSIADVLQPGPSTFRPSLTVEELVEYFRTSDERWAIVSTLGGRWIGMVRREDVLGDG